MPEENKQTEDLKILKELITFFDKPYHLRDSNDEKELSTLMERIENFDHSKDAGVKSLHELVKNYARQEREVTDKTLESQKAGKDTNDILELYNN